MPVYEQGETGIAVLVPGGHGGLGSELAALGSDTVTVRAPGSAELDITDKAAVATAIAELAETARSAHRRPIVINAAAHTAVDAAESEVDRATAVNATGPALLADACAEREVPLVHVSTDYVFPGDATVAYEPDDPTGPRSVYGSTKLAGERAVLGSGADAWVVRTAWVYGRTGGNFVKTLVRLEKERESLSVVDDQHGSPTYAADLAAGLMELAGAVLAGRVRDRRVLHCTGGGHTTWFGLARAIFEEIGADPARITPCTTAEFPRPAPRPAFSVLSDAAWRAAGLTPLRPWREALSAYFAD